MRFEVEGAGEANEERRLELHRIMAEAQDGDIVLVSKIDRWSRHAAFALTTAEELQRRGVEFRSIAEPGNLRDGKLNFSIRAVIAEEEHRKIRERTLAGRRHLRLGGNFVEGMAALGYDLHNRRLVINEAEAEIVRWIFARCIAGDSMRVIAAQMQSRWGVSIEFTGIAYLIRNRHYLGEMQTAAGREEINGYATGARFGSGEWVKSHEAIIDRHTFERAQRAAVGRKKTGRPGTSSHTKTWLCKGKLKCGECGGSVEAKAYTLSMSPRPGHEGWYGCRKRLMPKPTETRCTNGPLTRKALVDVLVGELVPKRLAELTAQLKKPSTKKAPALIDFAARRRRIEAKRAKLVDAFTDGIGISKADLRRKLEAFDAEKRSIDLDEHEQEKEKAILDVDTPETRQRSVVRLGEISILWNSVNDDDDATARRDMLDVLAERIELMGDGSVRIAWRQPAAMLEALGHV